MREFVFFGTWEDSFNIVDAILKTGKAAAMRDQTYSKPTPAFYTELNAELTGVIKSRRNILLWLPGTSVLPLTFARWEDGPNSGLYYVSGGGPTLHLVLPVCYEEQSRMKLGVGSLSCDNVYYDREAGLVRPMPPGATAAFEEFAKTIRLRCKRYGPKKRWVGLHAIELLEADRADIVSGGFWT